jgi:hypothetical protein
VVLPENPNYYDLKGTGATFSIGQAEQGGIYHGGRTNFEVDAPMATSWGSQNSWVSPLTPGAFFLFSLQNTNFAAIIGAKAQKREDGKKWHNRKRGWRISPPWT